MVKIGKCLALIAIVMSITNFVHGQEAPVVSATVDRNQMAVGDTFTLTIAISSSENVTAGEPRLVGLEEFELLNSWKGSESRSTFVNGKFSVERSINFNYQLAPKKSGALQLGSFEVILDGKVYNTKPISLQVSNSPLPGNTAQRQQQQDEEALPQELFEEDDLFTQLLKRRLNPGLRTQPSNPNEAFFIQVEVDKQKVYVGEQITATWYLYTKDNIRDLDTLKYPSLNGFWKEDLEISTRLNFTSEIVDGIPYRKALLASYALFPIKSGQSIIDPYKAKATFLNPFGFGQPANATKTSQPLKIQVVDLPTTDRPKDFSNAVGQFEMTAKIESTQLPANQPVVLKIRFEGKGNAKIIDLPPLNLPPSFELYDTKSETKFFPTGASYKEFLVFLIPRQAGEFTIPPVTVSFFDPIKNSYYGKSSEAFKVNVTPSGINQMAGKGFVGEENKKEEVEDKTYRMIPVYKEPSSWTFNSSLMGLGAILVFLIGALLYKARLELSSASKKKELLEEINTRIAKIEGLLGKSDFRAVGAEASNLIYFVLRKLVDNFENEVHFKQLMTQAPPSLRKRAGAELESLMEYFQTVGFAPESVVSQLFDKKTLKKKISEVEKILKLAIDSAGLTENEKIAQ